MRERLLRVLKNMYSNTKNCVLEGNMATKFFSVVAGLQQGCVLSPLLFSKYINGLTRNISATGVGL